MQRDRAWNCGTDANREVDVRHGPDVGAGDRLAELGPLRRTQVPRGAARLRSGAATAPLADTVACAPLTGTVAAAAFTGRAASVALSGCVPAAAIVRSRVPAAALAGFPSPGRTALAATFTSPAGAGLSSFGAAARGATGRTAALATASAADIGAAAGTACAADITRTAAGTARCTAARAADATTTGASAGTAASTGAHAGSARTAPGTTRAAALRQRRCRAEHQDRCCGRTAKEFRHVPSLSTAGRRRGAEARLATATGGEPFPGACDPGCSSQRSGQSVSACGSGAEVL